MCGRFSQTHATEQLAERFMVTAGMVDMGPRYNLAPSQTIPAVVHDGSHRRWRSFQWGLVPSWAKDPTIGQRMINARSETVAEKPSFRSALKKRRCLIPADGFYEWQKRSGRTKVPMYIQLKNKQPFAFAGLWESWVNPETNQPLETCTLCTTEPNALMKPIHDRMPVILRPESEATWLDPNLQSHDPLKALFEPYRSEDMTAHPVSTHVNSPAHEGPRCIEPVPDMPENLFDPGN